MIKKLTLLKLFLLNLFITERPSFVKLAYVDFIIDNKAIFLISWQLHYSYQISIPELHFHSFKRDSSAYIPVPDNIEYITVKILNSWSYKKETIRLLRLEMPDQIHFDQPKFNFLQQKNIKIPQVKYAKNKLKIKAFSIFKLKDKTIQIKNLNYTQN